ncbi:MAG TPA: pyridoxal-5'-phosphate-dependent protein subunit beta, partial [Thermoanaerobaculia bacterium]
MKTPPPSRTVVDSAVRERNIERLRESGIVLPKFSELADPSTIPQQIRDGLKSVDPDTPHPLNLFRVHWYNDRRTGGFNTVPDHVVLPSSLTGVDAKIVVLLGNRFPMIRAHKVLAAYACLIPRIMSGEFDVQRQKA